MFSTISFKKNKLNDKTVKIKSIGALPGVVKYVPKKDIPKVEEKSVLVYTTDTTELFIGGGVGQPLKRVSDIITVADVNALPEVGIKEKLYVSAADKIIYFWNDADGFQQVGGGPGGGGSVIQTKIIEYPAVAEFPAEGQPKAIYVAKDTDFLYRFDVDTARYIQLARQATDPTISAKFNAIDNALADKASKTDLTGFRTKAEKVLETDLDPVVTAKLNTNLVPYDDSALKSRISGLEASKVDKTALDGYRKKTDAVEETDLSAAVVSKLNTVALDYDDTALKARVSAVETGKTDQTYAESTYMKKADKVAESQLSADLATKLATLRTDVDAKATIAALETVKSNVTSLTTDVNNLTTAVNSKADSTTVTALGTNMKTMETDLSLASANITTLGTNITNLSAVVATKADASAVDACRKTTDKITAADLDTSITAEVTKVSTMETQIADLLARMAALESVASALEISSLTAISPLTVSYGTLYASLLLPTSITATLSDSSSVSLPIAWDSSTYNGNAAGTYTLTGALTLPVHVKNTAAFAPTIQVTVQANGSGSVAATPIVFTLPSLVRTKLVTDIDPNLVIDETEFYTGFYQVCYLGYVGNLLAEPLILPIGEGTTACPNGYAGFDVLTNMFEMQNASPGDQVYSIQRIAG